MKLLRRLKMRLLQATLERKIRRSMSKNPREKLRELDEKLSSPLVLAHLIPGSLTVPLAASPEEIVSKIFQPFLDVVALLVAITFGAGVLGFLLLVVDAVLSWVTGGSFGRSLAVSKFIRAAETLAVIPLTFFIVYILNTLGIQEISAVAHIMDGLLRRGWTVITSSLSLPP